MIGLFLRAFLIPLINTYLRLFPEYEQQTLKNHICVHLPVLSLPGVSLSNCRRVVKICSASVVRAGPASGRSGFTLGMMILGCARRVGLLFL